MTSEHIKNATTSAYSVDQNPREMVADIYQGVMSPTTPMGSLRT